MAMESPSRQKIKNCIVNSWAVISQELKKYLAAMKEGQKHVTLFVAHRTTAEVVASAEIEETDTFHMDQDIRSKLQHTITKEISVEQDAISDVTNDLEQIYSNIIREFDRTLKVYKSLSDSLSTEDLTEGSEVSLSTAEILEALDRFRMLFSDSHMCRKYSVEHSFCTGNLKDICDLWNPSDLETAEQDLVCIIGS